MSTQVHRFVYRLKNNEYKKVQNQLEGINDKKRRDGILIFLRNNPGCSKEELVRGLKNFISKKTIFKILKELEMEELITIKRDKPNSREYKLFLNNENILIILNEQISNFIEDFKKLLQKIETNIPDLTLLPFTNRDNKNKNFIRILFYEQLPFFLLKYVMQCLLLKSIIMWPKIIQKKEIRTRINSLVFTEISTLISDYSNFYNIKLSKHNIHHVNYNPFIYNELIKFDNDILFFEFFYRLCKKHGITKEYENILDKIWLLNSDVQKYLHPEARRYNLDYEYGKDDWRKFLKSYKENIIRIEKLENENKQILSSLVGDINIKDIL